LAVNVYEGMFLLDSGRFSRDPDGVAGRIARIVKGAGGQMLVSRLWEERRLAYPIDGHRKGTYWLTYFRVQGQKLGGIHRQCELNDAILRVLILKVDPRIVDTLVSHAQTETGKADAPAAKEPAGKAQTKPSSATTGSTATAVAEPPPKKGEK